MCALRCDPVFLFSNGILIIIIIISYCILRGRIKVLNSDAILCQQVVIALWLGSYRTVVG